MQIDFPKLGKELSQALIAALKSDSAKIKALAISEGEQLAFALTRIGGLLARREIDAEEAAILARIQRNASEAVLASLAEVSRVAAGKAIKAAIKSVLTSSLGQSPIAVILKAADA